MHMEGTVSDKKNEEAANQCVLESLVLEHDVVDDVGDSFPKKMLTHATFILHANCQIAVQGSRAHSNLKGMCAQNHSGYTVIFFHCSSSILRVATCIRPAFFKTLFTNPPTRLSISSLRKKIMFFEMRYFQDTLWEKIVESLWDHKDKNWIFPIFFSLLVPYIRLWTIVNQVFKNVGLVTANEQSRMNQECSKW